MSAETPSLTTLPWPCAFRVFQALPLQSCLVLSTTCKSLNTFVKADILKHIECLDLNQLNGQRVHDALMWAFCERLSGLHSIAASGHACLPSFQRACGCDTGRAKLRQLRSLHLDSLKQLQDSHVALLLPECPNLEVLALPRCTKLSDASALAAGAHLPRLRVAVCQDWTALTDLGVAGLAAGCPLLEELVLDGCLRVGSDGIAAVALRCRRLRRLSTARSYAVTDSALAALAAPGGGGGVEAAPSALEELSLRQCPRVAAVGLLGRCTGLTAVDFSGCPRVDAAGLSALLSGCGRTLVRLQLAGCVGLGGEALAGLGRACPRLRDLGLRGLALTDAHLQALAQDCTTLRCLGLAWCTRITDAGLVPLVERNTELEDLDLEALYLLSDCVLGALAAHTPRLSRLVLRMCARLSPSAIVALVGVSRLRTLALSGILDEAGTCELVAQLRRLRPGCALQW